MDINRNNYEELFILYIDNELSAVEREAVEAFVNHNTDLKVELEMLRQTVFPPDEPITFFNKEMLLRKEETEPPQLVNLQNCEEFFVLYADNELKNDENALVEEFIYRHPEHQEAFELIQQVKFSPDKSVVFPDKSLLYRSENDTRVVPMFKKMRFWKMAAAAAVIVMISGTVWFALQRGTGVNGSSALAHNQPAVNDRSANPTSPEVKTVNPQAPVNSSGISGEAAVAPPEHSGSSTTEHSGTNTTQRSGISTTEHSGNVAANGAGNNGKSNYDADNRSIVGAESAGLNKNNNQSVETNINNNGAPQIDVAHNTGKKVRKESNIELPQNVKQSVAGSNKGTELKIPSVDEQKMLDQTMASSQTPESVETSTVAIGPVVLKEGNVFSKLANENDEEFEQSDNKNKMRGFFRKVTRVFDKATSREPSENRKGIHIASFAIDLK